MDFLGGGGGSKEFGSSEANTTFGGDNYGGGSPLVVLGIVLAALAVALALVALLRK